MKITIADLPNGKYYVEIETVKHQEKVMEQAELIEFVIKVMTDNSTSKGNFVR